MTEANHFPRQRQTRSQKRFDLMPHALWFVGIAPAAAQLTGSAFNIWYNLSRVQPLLTPIQHTVFIYTVLIYNLLIYPIALTVWVQTVRSLGQSFEKLLQDQPIAIAEAIQARRRVINLPWLCVAIAGISWFLCIPIFLPEAGVKPLASDMGI